MKAGLNIRLVGVWLVALLWQGHWASALAASRIDWDAGRQQVEADIEDWPLPRVLEAISKATGWRVYVEPKTRITVSTRFKSAKPDEALRRLLGDLNFALLKPATGPAKLFVYRTSVQDATELVEVQTQAGKSNQRIPNELVVTLKAGASESIEDLAKRLGAKVAGRIDGLNAYRLQFDNEGAAQQARSVLNGDDDVSSVDNNFTVDLPNRLDPLAMSSIPSFNLNPNAAPNSEQLVVALIDTPVYGQGSPIKDFLLPGISLAGDTPASSPQLSHGTAMAETILQSIAANPQGTGSKNPRILPVDVYGGNPNTTTFDIARGIEAALAQNPSIFNLSLGSESDSAFLHEVIAQLKKQGFVFVAAAGNTPTTAPTYPAAWLEVTSVGAGTSSGALTPYSNRSDTMDMIAPGSSIVHFGDQAYLSTGTSTATAYASGEIAAYMLAHPGTTAVQAEAAIQASSPVPGAKKQ